MKDSLVILFKSFQSYRCCKYQLKAVLFVCLLGTVPQALSDDRATHFVGVADSSIQNIGKIIIQEICFTQKLQCDIEMLPAPRAERSMRDGQVNGEIMRVWRYGEDNPDFIRVPTSYYEIKTAFFTRKNTPLNISSVADITELNVGVLTGVKHTQNLGLNPQKVFYSATTEKMMDLLNKKRVDVVIASYMDGMATINKRYEAGLMVQPATIKTQPVYVYIHPNRQELVPIIDNAIKSLAKTGKLSAMIAEAEQKVLNEF
ncbi:substrate-binding periplasmic protein [Shewanella subflava]|uniref:Transporter substrate-binding domain-containing protein n=1 Tax=Shewanella subflava TaxID=2986476 RepID=A0ABT3IDH0_9GAMM|nr:transporter substrate-binding domain-containing protein [Shewanella subflava]MCW3174101.1 transporter substrate-binding domain-containing protein [Shewanella subflava]